MNALLPLFNAHEEISLGTPYEADSNKVKQVSGGITMQQSGGRTGGRRVGLEDTGLLLKPANILSDLIDVCRRHAGDTGHVSEFPVVGFHTVGCRALESRVTVMVGLINFVDQGRSLAGTGSLRPVTGGAIGVELGFSGLQFDRDGAAADRRLRLRGIAGSERSECRRK